MQCPWIYLVWTRCAYQNLHQNLIFLFLANNQNWHSKTFGLLPTMSTKKKIIGKTASFANIANSWLSKLQNSHWLVWTIKNFWAWQQNDFVHHRRIHQVCWNCGHSWQNSWNRGKWTNGSMVLPIRYTHSNPFRQWKRICQQTFQGTFSSPRN